MKAAQISEYGDPSVLQINEVDKPTAGADQVLVEVHASSINPFDGKLRAGYMKDYIPLQFPATLGGDIAGTIAEVGENVTGFAVGDKVYGQANVVAGASGGFAEYAAAAASQVAIAPENLDFTELASLPLVGVSALQGLTTHLNLRPGQKIFIHGGAGGIGTMAIPIAKHLGAYVATTATGDGLELVKGLGADEIIDFKTQDFTTVLKDFDAVFDMVGGEDIAKTLQILKTGGIAVSMVTPADDDQARELGVTAIYQRTQVTTAMLDELRGLIDAGVIKPQVDKVFALDQIQEAFQEKEDGSVKGKIVIQIHKSA